MPLIVRSSNRSASGLTSAAPKPRTTTEPNDIESM